MEKRNLVYIALGSNKGDRMNYLQDAVNTVFKTIGNVLNIARVYDTPAMGFESETSTDDFLNSCISVETVLSAENVLQQLQKIERQFRSRAKTDFRLRIPNN